MHKSSLSWAPDRQGECLGRGRGSSPAEQDDCSHRKSTCGSPVRIGRTTHLRKKATLASGPKFRRKRPRRAAAPRRQSPCCTAIFPPHRTAQRASVKGQHRCSFLCLLACTMCKRALRQTLVPVQIGRSCPIGLSVRRNSASPICHPNGLLLGRRHSYGRL